LLQKGDYAAALSTIQQESSEAWRKLGLPMAYRGLGDEAKYDAAIADLIAIDAKKWPAAIASVLAFSGDIDRSFEWLEKAASSHDPSLASISVESLFANLHSDARWLPFLRKIGRAPEQLAKIEFKVKLPQAKGGTASSGANH
jgi:hypothetical protein